jgi:hypothetical protein
MRPFTAVLAILSLGCASTAPTAGESAALGQWGGTVVSLSLTESGGTLSYQCGNGTIDGRWTVDADGGFHGAGQHFFGGGPLPESGRTPHQASYRGRIEGDRFTLSVDLGHMEQTLGPYTMTRGGHQVTELCL